MSAGPHPQSHDPVLDATKPTLLLPDFLKSHTHTHTHTHTSPPLQHTHEYSSSFTQRHNLTPHPHQHPRTRRCVLIRIFSLPQKFPTRHGLESSLFRCRLSAAVILDGRRCVSLVECVVAYLDNHELCCDKGGAHVSGLLCIVCV